MRDGVSASATRARVSGCGAGPGGESGPGPDREAPGSGSLGRAEAGFARPRGPGAGEALHVVLVHPEIPWNTGNAGRTCLAVGAALHLVEPLGFDLDERRVRRAGLDYWPRVAPRVWSGWEAFERALPELGEPFFFSAEAERSFWDVAYPPETVLVFGRETDGLSPELRARYRRRLLALPQQDRQLRSLNLSTAVAVACYEVLRQRRGTPLASVKKAETSRSRPPDPHEDSTMPQPTDNSQRRPNVTEPTAKPEGSDTPRSEPSFETLPEESDERGLPTNRPADQPSNREKDPEDWVTGDERMTGAQASYLETLCQEAGEEFDPDLTKAEGSKRIDELQERTGRGRE